MTCRRGAQLSTDDDDEESSLPPTPPGPRGSPRMPSEVLRTLARARRRAARRTQRWPSGWFTPPLAGPHTRQPLFPARAGRRHTTDYEKPLKLAPPRHAPSPPESHPGRSFVPGPWQWLSPQGFLGPPCAVRFISAELVRSIRAPALQGPPRLGAVTISRPARTNSAFHSRCQRPDRALATLRVCGNAAQRAARAKLVAKKWAVQQPEA